MRLNFVGTNTTNLMIISFSSSFKETFNNMQHMIVFHWNTTLKQLAGKNKKNNQKSFAPPQTITAGQCTHFTPLYLFAANNFLKQQRLQVLKPKRRLQLFTKSLVNSKHVSNNEHTFSKHGRVLKIEQLQNINTTLTETLKLRLNRKHWHLMP